MPCHLWKGEGMRKGKGGEVGRMSLQATHSFGLPKSVRAVKRSQLNCMHTLPKQ